MACCSKHLYFYVNDAPKIFNEMKECRQSSILNYPRVLLAECMVSVAVSELQLTW